MLRKRKVFENAMPRYRSPAIPIKRSIPWRIKPNLEADLAVVLRVITSVAMLSLDANDGFGFCVRRNEDRKGIFKMQEEAGIYFLNPISKLLIKN